MSSERFSQQGFSIANKLIRKRFLSWNETIKKDLEELTLVYQKYYHGLISLHQDKAGLIHYITHLQNFIKDILGWIPRIPTVPENKIKNDLWREWRDEIAKITSESPDHTIIEFAPDYWQPFPSDTIKIKLWKWKNRKQDHFKRWGYQQLNAIRSLFRKAPIVPLPRTHQFSAHQLSDKYLSLSGAQHILDTWQVLLQYLSRNIYQLHTDSKKVKDTLLFSGDVPSMCRFIDHKKQVEYLKHVESNMQILQEIQENLKELPEISVTRFEEGWEKTVNRFSTYWQFAGTYILPSKNFTPTQLQKDWQNLEKGAVHFLDSWKNHFDTESREWQKDLELSLLQIQVALICNQTLEKIENKIVNYFIPNFESAKSMLQQSLEKFTAVDIDNADYFKNLIEERRHYLLEKLRQEHLPKMLDDILIANIEGDFQSYLILVRNSLEALSDRFAIFTFRDLEELPPKSKTSDIPLEELIREDFFNQLQQSHLKITQDLHSRLENILRDISEIDQIVEYNLDAALSLLHEEEQSLQKTQKIVIEGLERTAKQINDLTENSLQIFALLQKELNESTSNFEQKVQDLADSDKIVELKLRVARTKTEEEFKTTIKNIRRLFRKFIPLARETVLKRTGHIFTYYRRFRKITGLSTQTIKIEEELTRFLTETELRIKALPYVYQRLFRLEPLTDERFFSGRDEELHKLKDQLGKWENGQYAATVIVGERGSGKTTLLNFSLQHYYQQYPLVRIELSRTIYQEEELLEVLKKGLGLPDPITFEELRLQILKSDQKKIVVIENIQNLFLRVINGFQVMELFLLLISQTNSKILWIVSSTLYSWNFLEKVLNVSKYFQKVISLGNLSEKEVQNVILKRHRVSGFEIIFSEPESVSESRKFKKLSTQEDRQEYLQQLFFRELNEISSGNITVAMLFWQRAISEVLTDRLIIHPLINIDFSFLHQLSYEDLFILAGMLQHEIMNESEITIVFHQNPQKSALILNRLYNAGIILKHPSGYYIHPFLYRAIVKTLQSKNILQ